MRVFGTFLILVLAGTCLAAKPNPAAISLNPDAQAAYQGKPLCYSPPNSNRVDFNLNADWKFLMADDARASQAAFDDSAWQSVSLPHTYNDGKFREWISTRNDTKM